MHSALHLYGLCFNVPHLVLCILCCAVLLYEFYYWFISQLILFFSVFLPLSLALALALLCFFFVAIMCTLILLRPFMPYAMFICAHSFRKFFNSVLVHFITFSRQNVKWWKASVAVEFTYRVLLCLLCFYCFSVLSHFFILFSFHHRVGPKQEITTEKSLLPRIFHAIKSLNLHFECGVHLWTSSLCGTSLQFANVWWWCFKDGFENKSVCKWAVIDAINRGIFTPFIAHFRIWWLDVAMLALVSAECAFNSKQ